MKKAIPALSGKKNELAVRAEQALLNQLPVNTKALQKAAKYLEPGKLKLIAIAVAGGAAMLSMLGSIGHERLYQAAVARELKKQLAPINEKLGQLEAQNEELKNQNEALQKELARR